MNGTDCGVYSIAFAVTLLFGYKPEKMAYNRTEMRLHLIKIFESRTIQHFSSLISFSSTCLQYNQSHATKTLNNSQTPNNIIVKQNTHGIYQCKTELSSIFKKQISLHDAEIAKKKDIMKKIEKKFCKNNERLMK